MNIGDRVQIVGDHPWQGERGTIVGTFDGHPPLEWTVELDEGAGYPGQQVAASSVDLRCSEPAS